MFGDDEAPHTLDMLIARLTELRSELGGDVRVTFPSPMKPVLGADYDDEDYHNVYIY